MFGILFILFLFGGGGGGGGGVWVCVFWFLGGVFFRGREGVWVLRCFLGEGFFFIVFLWVFSFCNTCNLNRGINK